MTEKRLTRIGVKSAMLHTFFVTFVLAYPLVGVMRFLQSFDPQRQGYPDSTAWWIVWIVVPIVLALLGSILVALSCLAYNLFARLLGGVRSEHNT